MKFTVIVTGEAALGLPEQDFELEASNGDEAVDAARARIEQLAPLEGGSLEIEVSAAEEWERVSKRSKGGGVVRELVPAGVVSSFGVYLEPHESVRAEVEEKRAAAAAAAEKAAERERIKDELRLELAAEQAAYGKVEVSK